MTKLISAASHAASKALALSGHSVKRSRVSEILSAMLGYQTYAALTTEDNDPSLEYCLGDAERLVLNPDAGQLRAQELGVAPISGIVQACALALQTVAPMPVHEDIDQFYDEYGREALADAIGSSDDVSSAMAETNAYFGGEPDMPEEMPYADDLWKSRVEWNLVARGKFKGDHDFDSDRMFSGDTLSCEATLMFVKAGRAGLILVEADAGAGVDDSWRDQDREDEAAYMASLRQPGT